MISNRKTPEEIKQKFEPTKSAITKKKKIVSSRKLLQ